MSRAANAHGNSQSRANAPADPFVKSRRLDAVSCRNGKIGVEHRRTTLVPEPPRPAILRSKPTSYGLPK